jgi:hypothetical protein
VLEIKKVSSVPLLFVMCQYIHLDVIFQIRVGVLDVVSKQGRRKQCEAAGAAISKRHLLLSHHFSGQQYLLKLYCMDTRLLLAMMGRKLRH